jgi:hypothetical protein
MIMEQYEETMSPEDAAALLAFAGPMFAQAKAIDANGMRDEYGNMPKPFSNELVSVLDVEVNKAKMKHRQANPVAYQTAPAHIPQPAVPQYAPPVQLAPQPQYTPQPVDEAQLEFQFNQTEQQKTNFLLEEISRKLTKVVGLLELTNKKNKDDVKNTFNQKETVTKLTK